MTMNVLVTFIKLTICTFQELLPDLYTHFQTQSFHTSMYASPWFLTLFVTVVPLNVACRIMDLFISEVSILVEIVDLRYLGSNGYDLFL